MLHGWYVILYGNATSARIWCPEKFVVKLSMFYKFPLKCNVYSAFLFLLYDVFCSQNIYSREYFQLMWFQEISVAKDSTYTI